MKDVTFRQIIDASDLALPAVRQIYLDGIPASERKAETWLVDILYRRDFALIVALLDEQPVGFATVFIPSQIPELALLEYLAIDSPHRGGGMGAKLFRHALSMIPNRSLLLEVDSDREPSPLQVERARRLAFYHRLGCRRIVGLNYRLPLDTNPPLMELLIANPPNPLRKATLATWLGIIYPQVYGQPSDDSRINEMISPLQDPIDTVVCHTLTL